MSDLVKALNEQLKKCNWMMATAESCTGGLIASTITHIPGSSAIFDRGFVTYSNESKTELLKVPEEIIRKHGAVSEETALAMVSGALKFSQANVAVAVTGIAGPEGGNDEKPVGLVYIAVGREDKQPKAKKYLFEGDRQKIRAQAIIAALEDTISLFS